MPPHRQSREGAYTSSLKDYGHVTKDLLSLFRHSGLRHSGMTVVGLCRSLVSLENDLIMKTCFHAWR
jgi:hypothetical protein